LIDLCPIFWSEGISDEGLLVAPTTSEIVRLALHVMEKAPHSKLRKAVAAVPDRRAGRPKGVRLKPF
jgi:hypothetical protein